MGVTRRTTPLALHWLRVISWKQKLASIGHVMVIPEYLRERQPVMDLRSLAWLAPQITEHKIWMTLSTNLDLVSSFDPVLARLNDKNQFWKDFLTTMSFFV